MKINMDIVNNIQKDINTKEGADVVKEFMNEEEFYTLAKSAYDGAVVFGFVMTPEKSFVSIFAAFFYLGYKYRQTTEEVESLNKAFAKDK